MNRHLLQTTENGLSEKVKEWSEKNIELILCFTSKNIIKSGMALETLKQNFPNTQIIGCSTSGEIGEHVEDDSISLMGLGFESTPIKCIAVPIESAESSFAAGEQMGNNLQADNLAGVFMLLPGVNVNGSQFTEGLKKVIGNDISISGGMAGDGLDFQETCTILNDTYYSDHAIGLAFYGSNVVIKSGSRGGWKPFGPARRVTKAQGNILYELDGKSALQLYKDYLGDKAADLPSSGLYYPFSILQNNAEDGSAGLIRTILNIDEDAQSLILAGDLEVGQHVSLMHSNTDDLVEGAEAAAQDIIDKSDSISAESAIICVSCVGRKILMGDDTEDELDAVRELFEEHDCISGFYSYGEICHFDGTNETELHNQTMTITYITENAA